MPVPYYLRPDLTHLAEGPDDTLDPSEAPTDAAARSVAVLDWPPVNTSPGPEGPPDEPPPPPTDPAARSLPPFEWSRVEVKNALRQLGIPLPDLDPDIALWPVTPLQRWPFTGPPTVGIWPIGWMGVDNTGTPYVCTLGGQPGTWAALNATATTFNVLNFGADPTGVNDSGPAFTAALQAAFNTSTPFVTVYVPAGTYKIATTVKPFAASPGTQTQVIYLTGAGVNDTILQQAWMGTSDMLYFIGAPVIVSDMTFDNNAGTGHSIIFYNQYVNQHTVQSCSATAGTLTITLGSQVGASALPPGSVVCLQNTSAQATSVPFAGTVQSYNVNGGGIGIDTITVNPNGLYPTINTTISSTPMSYGTAVCVVSRDEVQRVTFKNRGSSWASITLTNVTGGSGTFTYGGSQFTLTYGMTANQINNAINAVLNAVTPIGSYNRLNVFVTPSGATLGQPGSVLYLVGLGQGGSVAFAAGGNNFTGTGATATINNQVNAVGRDILVNDASNQWPSNLLDFSAENVVFESECGDIQECQGLINVRRASLRRQRYLNTFTARGTIAAGSTTLQMDGVLPSPPPAGLPIGVQNAGPAPYTVTSQTAGTNLYIPYVLTMSGPLSAADLAALTPGCTVSVPGAGASGAALVSPVTYVWTLSGRTYIWLLNPAVTTVTTVTITITASHLQTTVAQPGSSTVTNANGAQVTQIPLTIPAGVSVSESFVGMGGGRAIFDMYAVDRGWSDDIKMLLGIFSNVTFIGLGWNYGCQAIHDIGAFAIDDPFNTGGFSAQMNVDSQWLRASKWDLPTTCNVSLARWHPTGQRLSFVDCDLRGGVQFSNSPTWTRFDNCSLWLGTNRNVAVFSQNGALGDSGPIYITGGEVQAGTGMVFGCTALTSSNAFNPFWVGGRCVFGAFLAGRLSGASGVTFDAGFQIRNVPGINPAPTGVPVSSLFPSFPTTAPASGVAWTNNTGTDVDIYYIGGATLTNVTLDAVNVSLSGPWRVLVGGVIQWTYTGTPVLNAVYQ